MFKIKLYNTLICSMIVIHYIHIPEAFIEVKLVHPFAKTVVFLH